MRKQRSYTKKGPGRYHGQGTMVTLEHEGIQRRMVMEPKQRYPYPQHGGYIRGMPYVSQGDHDRAVRRRLEAMTVLHAAGELF